MVDESPMVKDVRQDPLFERRKTETRGGQKLRSDYWPEYQELVDETITSRIPRILGAGILFYIFFNYADRASYPSYAPLFFWIRAAVAFFSLGMLVPVFFKPARKYSVWTLDGATLLMVAGICYMIYRTDGASSQYHAGINLILLAMTALNTFYFWHNLGVCLIVVGLYATAVLMNSAGWNFDRFFVALLFMTSTSFFVVLLTRFYSLQHNRAFIRSRQLEESERKLKTLYSLAEERSKIDDLTKIYNRRYFFELLADKIAGCKMTGAFFYLVILDIDHFKKVNDKHGHAFGDQVIAVVAKAISQATRLNSYIGRYGGDEFMLIIDQASREEFLTRVQTIRNAIRQLALFHGDQKVALSASFGAARFEPGSMDEKMLIDLADSALLEVKRTQRGGIKLAN